MKVSLKAILSFWIVLLLVIGGLLYNAYSKFKPEAFISLLTEQVQRNYPGAKLQVGKIDYRFSLDFNLNLQNIHLRRDGKLLASVGEVELKVPWWLLIVKKGNAQINVTKLDIFIDHNENHEVKIGSNNKDRSQKAISVTMPDYLVDAQYTLRAKAVTIRDIHNSRRYFELSKLLVREFQYGKNSAFELNIPIQITHNKVIYKSDLWLFGDVTPDTTQWKLNYRGEFRPRDNSDKFQIEDVVIGGKAIFRPTELEINSDVELLIEKDPIGNGTLSVSQDELSLQFILTQVPLNYFVFIQDQIKGPYLPKLAGEANGAFKFYKNFDADVANINGKLAFDGDIFLASDERIPGKWQLNFEDTRWELSFMSPKGEASFFRRTMMDLENGQASQYIEQVGFTGLDLNKVLANVPTLAKISGTPSENYYNSTVSFKKCLLGDKTFDGNIHYGVTPDQYFYQVEVSGLSSSFNLSYSKKMDEHFLNANFSKFPWSSQFMFLTPYFNSSETILNGKLEGRWQGTWDSGIWLGQLSSENGEGQKGFVFDLLDKTAGVFDIKKSTVKKWDLNFSLKSQQISLTSLLLDNGDSGKISGVLNSTDKTKSHLILAYPKNKKWKPVRKEVTEIYWK